jgi:glycogen operon protein
LLLIVNAHHEAVVFKLPTVVGGRDWRRLLDTNQPEPGRPKPFEFGHDYVVTGRSLLLFKLSRDRSRSDAPASASPSAG